MGLRSCSQTELACYAESSMNFFGHATLAARFSDRPEFVLGRCCRISPIGVELLLDASLAESAAARSAYVAGLRAGQRPELLRGLLWPSAEQARLAGLMSRLEGAFEDHGGMAQVPASLIVERLSRMLGRRPRLAIAPCDVPAVAAVGDWVELCHGAVVAPIPALVSELTCDVERLWQYFLQGEDPCLVQ